MTTALSGTPSPFRRLLLPLLGLPCAVAVAAAVVCQRCCRSYILVRIAAGVAVMGVFFVDGSSRSWISPAGRRGCTSSARGTDVA